LTPDRFWTAADESDGLGCVRPIIAILEHSRSRETARKGIVLARCLRVKVAVVVTGPSATYFARELAAIVSDVVVPEAVYKAKRHAKAMLLLRSIGAEAYAAGAAAKGVHRSDSHPSRAISSSWHHMPNAGLADFLIGSETMKLRTRTSIPC
jgi:hypothetical protein